MSARPFALHRYGSHLIRGLLVLAFLAASGGASATWKGSFNSEAKQRQVMVEVTLPAGSAKGKLGFPSERCEIGLDASGPDRFIPVLLSRDQNPGDYCFTWVGGQFEIAARKGDDLMHILVTSRSGRSKFTATLSER